jgi:23S rRNA (cytidine1920-2'-O)/16S rRNA (cytidine1409-2'-O)-methyltransferase
MDQFPEPVDLVTLDVSFISTKRILPVVKSWFKDSIGKLIVLIKPQFEATKTQSSQGKGVIKDPAIHKQVLFDVLQFAENEGYQIAGLMQSPIMGPKGNKEFFAELRLPAQTNVELNKIIEALLPLE